MSLASRDVTVKLKTDTVTSSCTVGRSEEAGLNVVRVTGLQCCQQSTREDKQVLDRHALPVDGGERRLGKE